jgi:predicted nucleotidyltransferase
MDDLAFLSFRLPKAARDRLRTLAARRGSTVQDIMRDAVLQLLDKAEAAAPQLPEVLIRLRNRQTELRQQGVSKLWVFGSAARGEARLDSDIDLIVAFDPDAKVSLTGFARLRSELSDILGRPVDLAEWRTLRTHVRAAAEREAVEVF